METPFDPNPNKKSTPSISGAAEDLVNATTVMLSEMRAVVSMIDKHLDVPYLPTMVSHGYDISLKTFGDEGGLMITPSNNPDEPPPLYNAISGENVNAANSPAFQAVAIAKDVFKALKVVIGRGESVAWLKLISIKATNESPYGLLNLRYGSITGINVVQGETDAVDPLATDEELIEMSSSRLAYGAIIGQELKKSGIAFSRFAKVTTKLSSHQYDDRWLSAKL